MTANRVPRRTAVRARRFRLVPLLFLSLALPALSGCISEGQEQGLGNEMAATVNKQLALVRNPLLNAYVSSLGRAIAAVSGRPGLDYQFYIINSEAVNAFALPGGHVYVTRGLIERTRSGPELAGVLAHEIGHVVQRHGVEKLQRHLRTGSLVNVLYSIILGGEPEMLSDNPLRLAGMLWTANHSREDENEADKLAVQYLVRAGVDPRGMLTLLQNLLQVEQADSTTVPSAWFSSHPLTATRIAETESVIRADLPQVEQVDNAPELKFASYPAFLRLIAALPPGSGRGAAVTLPVALSIAGSDSGGGAGIQADLKTFHAFGVFGTTAVTAITVQSTLGVTGVHPIPIETVRAQIQAVAEDLHPAAFKTGMLATAELVRTVAEAIGELGLKSYVLDPVMVATSGHRLLAEDAEGEIMRLLVPLAAVVTPNLDEASILAGFPVRTPDDMRRAAEVLVARGAGAALLKGGHLDSADLVDILFDGSEWREWRRTRLETTSTHGTGCTLSAAVAAGLAHARPMVTAVDEALDYVHRALVAAPGLGSGHGPLNHLVRDRSEGRGRREE